MLGNLKTQESSSFRERRISINQTKGCLHFGICGGCQFQNLSYETQLKNKEQQILDLFSPFASKKLPIIGLEDPWHYRNKMEFSFSQNKKGEKFLGFFQKGKPRVENLMMCSISPHWFIDALEKAREFWGQSNLEAYFPPKNSGSLMNLTLRNGVYTDQKMAVLTISGESAFTNEHIQQFKHSLASLDLDSLILRKRHIAKGKATVFEETVLQGNAHIYEKATVLKKTLTFKIKAASFFQPNTLGAEKVYTKALEMAEIHSEDVVLDLYCGIGPIGMFASSYSKKVYGIEIVDEAINDAKDNLKLNQIDSMEVIHADVNHLKTLPFATIIFVDPPRSGLSSQALNLILSIKPKKIIYISCNPLTQYRDILELLNQGYLIKQIQPIDQFPHTKHLENIIALEALFCYH